ncbi:hypothetical protein XHC_2220 [Xanthomonas hortorum pv. carotae str. M081]|nr:hypothetical protein XHC_2220 [Xanthomonas hortorum pv. carotae str. M081]
MQQPGLWKKRVPHDRFFFMNKESSGRAASVLDNVSA